ncbi:MAG: SMC-Scp complex subunit ScpB [Methylococcales bacterium]|nr:SMC-Scp complex subunit ScpB [Methylococcales bacterium]MBT7444913.1 SMC-Scp complex subunit ScpB [Methylococcales bacterium]
MFESLVSPLLVSINIKNIVEAALLASGRVLNLEQMLALFEESEKPAKAELVQLLNELANDYEGRGMMLTQIASGYRIQVRDDYAWWVSRLWEEKSSKYSRALLETLAIIAYRQPITRGEIEDIRGVSVSSSIVKTLIEREWVRVVGQREVPGRPSMLGTTRIFLDYFNLKTLDDLPTLAELRDLDDIGAHLEAAFKANNEDPGAEMDDDAEMATPEIKLTVVDGGQSNLTVDDESKTDNPQTPLTLVPDTNKTLDETE